MGACKISLCTLTRPYQLNLLSPLRFSFSFFSFPLFPFVKKSNGNFRKSLGNTDMFVLCSKALCRDTSLCSKLSTKYHEGKQS